jgi:hypothetical protein
MKAFLCVVLLNLAFMLLGAIGMDALEFETTGECVGCEIVQFDKR